jgi:hypothetical protein
MDVGGFSKEKGLAGKSTSSLSAAAREVFRIPVRIPFLAEGLG